MSSLNDLSIIERPLHSATTQMVHNKHLQTSDPNYPDLKFLHLTTKLRVFNNHQMVSLHNISFRVHTSTVKLHLGSQRTQVLKILKSWTVPENAGHRIGGLSMPHLSPPIVWHSFTNFTKKKKNLYSYIFSIFIYTLLLHFTSALFIYTLPRLVLLIYGRMYPLERRWSRCQFRSSESSNIIW